MAKEKIIIIVDSEKIIAIKQFMAENPDSIEVQLAVTFDKIYEKSVPLPVRQYIDAVSKNVVVTPKREVSKHKTQIEDTSNTVKTSL